MFEGAIAAFLNRLLGKYIEDLDIEQFNFGIFSGDTCLVDLKLKPEALYQLGLPIKVEVGVIGKIILKIPWSGLFSQPIVLYIEDVYILAVSTKAGHYDSEIEKKLIRAEKKKILEDLQSEGTSKSAIGLPPDLFDSLMASVIRNFQITINNVHIRFEEKLQINMLCACGICIQSISMTTTNNKWKPGVCANNSQTVYQLMKIESLSLYLDNDTESCSTMSMDTWDMASVLAWKEIMHTALQTFGLRHKEFQFLLKPFTAKIKVIIHRGNETQPSRILVDIVLQDVAMQISEIQYMIFCQLYESILNGMLNRPYRKYRPYRSVSENPAAWWKYAYYSILDYNVRPYYWSNVFEYRRNYRKYKDLYARSLLQPNDAELKLDLQKFEDYLSILNIIIAREHARQELQNKNIEEICQKKKINQSEKKTTAIVSYKIQDVMVECNEWSTKKSANNLIGNGPSGKIKFDKLPGPIDFKYNFTLANCSVSLLCNGREVLVSTVTQFLTSVEAQPALSTYKVSVRAESLVIEGASHDGELVPLVTVDNVLTGNVSTNFLAIDFEKSKVNGDECFHITMNLNTIEVTYNHFVAIELTKFFKVNDSCIQTIILWTHKLFEAAKKTVLNLMDNIISQTLRIYLKMEIKGPYIIFPEYGSIQKGGHILVVDSGDVILCNELQSTNLQLEDVTLMEMEELLYDRLNMIFNGAQILFCHSGDEWRSVRQQKDSEYHFLSQMQANATLSYSIKPEYRQLPRTKLNMAVTSMKFNFAENKLKLILHYVNILSAFYLHEVNICISYLNEIMRRKRQCGCSNPLKQLIEVRSNIYVPSVSMTQGRSDPITKDLLTNNIPKLDRNIVSSEVSEEDLELLSRTVNLSGFDDNMSPCNHVNLLLRFAIGELSIHLGYVVLGREEPYLNLRLHTIYLETAVMEYGPAIQFGIGSLLLIDKTNAGVTGSYLELISTSESQEVFVMSYRKVKSNCPDFKSHFRSIERSFIINLLTINIIFHRGAILKIKEYWNNFNAIFQTDVIHILMNDTFEAIKHWKEQGCDPPIPPGAIKLNYSARLGMLSVRFCDKDRDLADVKIVGIENDCIYNANERMIWRAHIRRILIEDLNHDTLYAKIFATDEDKVLDVKYVRHTPRLYVCSDIDTNQDDVMSDGTFKLSIGKINCVLISRILQDFQHFFEPFISLCFVQFLTYWKIKFNNGIKDFKQTSIKLHVFIDVQGPIFLLPQKKDIPNLLVLDTGLLTVENFFKKVEQSTSSSRNSDIDTNHLIIDNILMKLKSVTVSRAIMTLRGDLEVQEPIIEPIHIHFDIKRKTEYRSAVEFQTYGLFNVQGSMDHVFINLSQNDFKSIILVWRDNISKILIRRKICDMQQNRVKCSSNIMKTEDGMVKKLEVFLAYNSTKFSEVNIKVTLEGVQVNLFLDAEEVLSSPVRDLNRGLCKLCLGEIISIFEFYSDESLKIKLSLQNCILQDTRKESTVIKRIIQSPAKFIGLNMESCISISLSPIVDIMYNQAAAGDKCFDVLIQETRFNLSVPFLMHLGRYFVDSMPVHQVDEGIINHAYENNNQTVNDNVTTTGTDNLNSVQYFQEHSDTSISVKIQKPEILLFGDLKMSNAHVILLQAEVAIECSKHNSASSIVCTFTDVKAKTRRHRNYIHPYSHWLLMPCDIEVCSKQHLAEHSSEIVVSVTTIDVHLFAEIVHTFIEILNELLNFSNNVGLKYNYRNMSQEFNTQLDLWTPKKVLNVPYKEVEDSNNQLYVEQNHDIVTLYLKPVLLRIYIEMDNTVEKLPVIKVETVLTAFIADVLNNYQSEISIKTHAFSYNMNCKSWEPLIELHTKDDVKYEPWELIIKICRGEAYVIKPTWNDSYQFIQNDMFKKQKKDIEDCESTDMIFISPDSTIPSRLCKETSQYDDSDTDEDETPKKLTKTFNYLFNNDSSEGEDTDSDDSSTNDDDLLDLTSDTNAEPHDIMNQKMKQPCSSATYIIVNAKERFDITITPDMITIVNLILEAFMQANSGIPSVPINIGKLSLQNHIGHESKIEVVVHEEIDNKNVTRIIAMQECHDSNSPPSVPSSPDVEPNSSTSSPQWLSNDNNDPDFENISQNHSIPMHDLFYNESPVHIYKKVTAELLHIMCEGFTDILLYCPHKQICTLVPLRPAKHDIRYHLVIEVTIDNYLHRTITVRSPLQFRNETSYTLGLYYKKQLLEKLKFKHIGETTNPFDDNIRLTIIEPDCTYSVPLYIAYHFPIHVLPVYVEKYQVSDNGIYWKELNMDGSVSKDIYCTAKDEQNQAMFGIKAVGTELPLISSLGCHVPNYLISMLPPFIFHNQLPFVIEIEIPSSAYKMKIEPGEKINVHSLRCSDDTQFVFKIHTYLGSQWTGIAKMNFNIEKKVVLMRAETESESTKPFLLSIDLCKMRSWNLIIQCQYWIINKSGIPLFIQDCQSHMIYEVPEEELLVFSQKNNKRELIMLRAHQSEWSLSFGLDGINSMSVIVCKDIERGRKYKILTEIETSRLSPCFTKILTFLPQFFIDNRTKRSLRFMEENDNADLWNDIAAGQIIPFWPVTESMKMRVKLKNSQLVSQQFNVTDVGCTVLRMDAGSALCIEIEGGISSPYRIIFRKYLTGDAPIRIDNLCDQLFLKINQVDLGQVTLVNPFQSLLYTWDEPTKLKKLIWNVYNNKNSGYTAQFETDGFGQEKVSFVTIDRHVNGCHISTSMSLLNTKSVSDDLQTLNNHMNTDRGEKIPTKLDEVKKDETVVYWVSYMEGNQRVLLFTQYENIFLKARSIIDDELSKKEVFVSLAGIGLNIAIKLDGIIREFAYGTISDSAAHWDLYFGKKWKNLSLELSSWIEHKYASFSAKAQYENLVDIDLIKMHMTKPFFGKLRRTYTPGIWLHCRMSEAYTYLQGHIHQIQIDNQNRDAVFPVVLYASAQKNYINYAGNCKLQHCLEFISLRQQKLNQSIYKGISIIVRDVSVNLEEDFLLFLLHFIPRKVETKHSIATKLRKDVSNIHIVSGRKNSTVSDNKNADVRIESIYISPILVRLKLLSKPEGSNVYNFSILDNYYNMVRFIFQYAQSGILEKVAELKLPCYKKAIFKTTTKQFFSEFSRNYAIQIRQQFHVLIRSATILGNEYCYNFKYPGTQFYESDSLLMCTDEVSEKLCHTLKHLLRHSTADVTQISNLNFNICEPQFHNTKVKESYFENCDIAPLICTMENLFSIEFELEISGLISRCVNSTHREEIKYLFHSLKKKMSTLFEMENSSLKSCSMVLLDTIKRAQEIGHKFTCRVRLPRYINPYVGVEIYSTHKAKGMYLLHVVDKPLHNDEYWAHAALSNDGKHIALVSLQRVYFIVKGCSWGSWEIKWSIETNQLLSPPTVINDKLFLHVNKTEDPSSPVVDWYLECKETGVLEWLCRKINTAMILNMESSICSKQDA